MKKYWKSSWESRANKKFNDIEQFFEQLIEYFPDKISKSKDEVQDFYEYMVENRGAYFYAKNSKKLAWK